MLEAKRDDGFLDLRGHAARTARRPAIEQQLRCLLRNRRSAFDDAALGEIGTKGSNNRGHIDAGMTPEPTVLGRNGGSHE